MEKYRGYRIESTENGFRITLNDGSDKHTHIHSRHFCKKLINYVVNKKVPTRVSNYVLESCKRLSTDKQYIKKIDELLMVREQKGGKQPYVNPGVKKSF